MFAILLRGLGEHDLITQAGDGTVVLGGVGERIVNHYSFYTAFTTPEEYRLVSEGRNLGTLPIIIPLTEGSYLIFAGQRWQVIAIEPRQKVIDLVPAPGGMLPQFSGTGAAVHDRVRQEMFQVYSSGDIPSFLDATARDLLIEARGNFARLDLVEKRVIPHGTDSLLFCWMGDHVLNTITLQLKARGLVASHDDLAITAENCSVADLLDAINTLVANGPADARQLARIVVDKLEQKYDPYLPNDLLTADYAARNLQTFDAWAVLRELTRSREA